MRLPIKENLDYIATSGVRQGCINAGINATLTNLIVDTYKNVMAHYAAWSDHYVWESDNEDELRTAIVDLHISLIKCNKYRFDLIAAEFPDFKDGTDTVVDSGSNSSNGMSETAPIDAVLGDITTPNAKSKASGSYSNNRTEKYYRNKKDAYKFAFENNMYTIICDIFEPIIHEHNWIY